MYKCAKNDGINMKAEKKKTHQMQYNYFKLTGRDAARKPLQVIKTFRIVQQGEVSLLRVASF